MNTPFLTCVKYTVKGKLSLANIKVSHLCHMLISIQVSESQDNPEFQETLKKTNDARDFYFENNVFPVLDNAMVGHTYLTLISLPEEKKKSFLKF